MAVTIKFRMKSKSRRHLCPLLLDLQDAVDAIAESERLGEQPIPWESVMEKLV